MSRVRDEIVVCVFGSPVSERDALSVSRSKKCVLRWRSESSNVDSLEPHVGGGIHHPPPPHGIRNMWGDSFFGEITGSPVPRSRTDSSWSLFLLRLDGRPTLSFLAENRCPLGETPRFCAEPSGGGNYETAPWTEFRGERSYVHHGIWIGVRGHSLGKIHTSLECLPVDNVLKLHRPRDPWQDPRQFWGSPTLTECHKVGVRAYRPPKVVEIQKGYLCLA